MYLPRNKYRIKTATQNEIQRLDGTPFVGSYIEVSNGSIFEGANLAGRKQVLKKPDAIQGTNIERPYNDYYGPTEADYENGEYTRYFTRSRKGKFTEMNKEQWLAKRNQKGLTAGQLTWLLTGPVQDGKYKGIPFKGTASKNRETLQKLERQFPGISDFFKSTSEFVR